MMIDMIDSFSGIREACNPQGFNRQALVKNTHICSTLLFHRFYSCLRSAIRYARRPEFSVRFFPYTSCFLPAFIMYDPGRNERVSLSFLFLFLRFS